MTVDAIMASIVSACQPDVPRKTNAHDAAARHQPAKSVLAANASDAARWEFWRRRSRDFVRASREPELVARAMRAVTRSEVKARIEGGRPIEFVDALIDAYRADVSHRFKGGRQPDAVGPLRRAIRRELARSNRSLSTEALWEAVKCRPPRGWMFHDNRAGKYAEGPKAGQNTDYRSFATACSKERGRLKSSVSEGMNGLCHDEANLNPTRSCNEQSESPE